MPIKTVRQLMERYADCRVKEARDIILREAVEKADIETMDQINFRVDKSSILNLANSEELNKKLGL